MLFRSVGYLGITDMTADEDKALIAAKGTDAAGKAFDNTLKLLTAMVNKRAKIGWTTGGHTGEDSVLYVYANGYENRLTGTIQNSDVAKYAAKAMGLSLEQATISLYVPHTALEKMGFKVSLDTTKSGSAILKLEKQGKVFQVLENKNGLAYNMYMKYYNGINVYNGQNFYIPQAAIDMMERMIKMNAK